MFEETSNTITALTADFGTQKTHSIYKNNAFVRPSIDITYKESGYKTLTFTATFRDGTTKTTQGTLHVKVPQTNQARTANDPLIDNFTIDATIPYQGYGETSAVLGKLDYRVYYHTNNDNALKKLIKPIVIIDGFDPKDKRKISDEDSNLPADNHFSLEEMILFEDNQGVEQDIIELLRKEGYDVVIVNHPTYKRGGKTIDGGADYIERNAYAHVALYKHLRAKVFGNGSSEELVIIGPSMGGQISRFALAYMEKHNIAHNTRLWVSVDSPHLGANIPIGMQAMINLLDAFGGSVSASDFYNDELKSPARCYRNGSNPITNPQKTFHCITFSTR
mgnify:CR=1 FL=1